MAERRIRCRVKLRQNRYLTGYIFINSHFLVICNELRWLRPFKQEFKAITKVPRSVARRIENSI